jgi:hypothetical protein
MIIQYEYEIVSVNAEGRCMDVRYTSEGRETMLVGARLPFEGETLESVIRAYAPTAYWEERELPVVVPEVGTSGQVLLSSEADQAALSEPTEAIFPTPASGRIDTTVIE